MLCESQAVEGQSRRFWPLGISHSAMLAAVALGRWQSAQGRAVLNDSSYDELSTPYIVHHTLPGTTSVISMDPSHQSTSELHGAYVGKLE